MEGRCDQQTEKGRGVAIGCREVESWGKVLFREFCRFRGDAVAEGGGRMRLQ